MRKRKGAILIMTMLILFLILALVFVVFYSIQKSQSITAIVNQRQIMESNGYSITKYIKKDILNSEMGNYRLQNGSLLIGEDLYGYGVTYEQLTEDPRKYLIISVDLR